MGFFSDLWNGISSVGSSIWNGVKDVAGTVYNGAKKAVDWVLDRIYTISGIATISLGAVLLILSHFGFTQSIPNEFSNVIVNSVILLGITILKYGQSKDNYKNISEI